MRNASLGIDYPKVLIDYSGWAKVMVYHPVCAIYMSNTNRSSLLANLGLISVIQLLCASESAVGFGIYLYVV